MLSEVLSRSQILVWSHGNVVTPFYLHNINPDSESSLSHSLLRAVIVHGRSAQNKKMP
jgi:hypothetical protein